MEGMAAMVPSMARAAAGHRSPACSALDARFAGAQTREQFTGRSAAPGQRTQWGRIAYPAEVRGQCVRAAEPEHRAAWQVLQPCCPLSVVVPDPHEIRVILRHYRILQRMGLRTPTGVWP